MSEQMSKIHVRPSEPKRTEQAEDPVQEQAGMLGQADEPEAG